MTDPHEMLLEKQRDSKEVICVLDGEEFEMFGSIFKVDSLLILNNIRATWMSHPSLCLTSQFFELFVNTNFLLQAILSHRIP